MDDKHLIDKEDDADSFASLMLEMNAFVSIDTAEKITTLDKTTQYRERIKGRFPRLHVITARGRRKAYHIQDLLEWIKDPVNYRTRD